MKISVLESELKKRFDFPYKWGIKQNNLLDRKTNFIYKIFPFEELLSRIDAEFKAEQNYDLLQNYSLNRWYNFWSARAVENIFCTFDNVTAEKNRRNRLSDFEICKIKFDLKTTIFPKNYKNELSYALNNKNDLINWLYQNQSREQRKHYKNRLFIVFYDAEGEHWKLKAEIRWIKNLITPYIKNFSVENLQKFFFKGEEIYADIIWGIKQGN